MRDCLFACLIGGYITINYTKLERDIRGLVDLNKDGKVDLEDYKLFSTKFVTMLSNNNAGTEIDMTPVVHPAKRRTLYHDGFRRLDWCGRWVCARPQDVNGWMQRFVLVNLE